MEQFYLEINNLLNEMSTAEKDGDLAKKDMIQKKIDCIKTYMTNQLHEKKFLNEQQKTIRRISDTVSKRIKSVITELRDPKYDLPKLAEHLDSIERGRNCLYKCPENLEWQL